MSDSVPTLWSHSSVMPGFGPLTGDQLRSLGGENPLQQREALGTRASPQSPSTPASAHDCGNPEGDRFFGNGTGGDWQEEEQRQQHQPKVGVWMLVGLIFYSVSGGPLGIEVTSSSLRTEKLANDFTSPCAARLHRYSRWRCALGVHSLPLSVSSSCL